MLELEEAQRRILATVPVLPSETVSLADAGGRILAEEMVAGLDLPLFDNSAMDGYAVRSANVIAASASNPVSLRRQGEVAAGGAFPEELATGCCIRVFTGSPLPRGADAVVMQEDTRPHPADPGCVEILEGAKPWENVRLQGEDVKRGQCLIESGERLTAGRINLLASQGQAAVRVGRQPRIGLIATGDELTEIGQLLGPGKIFESNRFSLAILVRQAGGRAALRPLVRDSLAATRGALEEALRECDAVVTSGGVSVGELDYVKDAWEGIGGELAFWKVAIRPGKPFVFGTWRGDKFLFGLPGNPVSALVTFLLLVRPALLRMQGAKDLFLPRQPGTLVEGLENRGDRRHFMRVTVDGNGKVHSTGRQASHILLSLADANGLVDVPARMVLAPGSVVSVLRWE